MGGNREFTPGPEEIVFLSAFMFLFSWVSCHGIVISFALPPPLL